ncbi:MAG: SPOR domain-containing protein [Salibacteraceae bacterium]
MATSGRDRDPAFRKKATSKPASAPKKVVPVKKVEAVTPETTPPPTPKPTNDPLTSPVVEPQRKIEPALETESKGAQKDTPTPIVTNKKTGEKTSKKSKLIGILVAILFLIGIAALGYLVITNILGSEGKEKDNTEMSSSIDENNSSEEGDAQAGAVEEGDSSEGNTSSDGINSEESNGEEDLRETTLSEDNSIEPAVENNNEGTSDKAQDENAKKALSSAIKKKGDFEIPCWIVAFSANNKKPLANMNYSALEALGYDAGIYWIPKYFPGGNEMYKVYVGPYKSPEEAQAILPQIRNLQPDAYIMKIDE